MTTETGQTEAIFEVLINHEEQYSIWPAGKAIPLGWSTVGKNGPKDACLEYIKENWVDMRPLSLRKEMAEMSLNATPDQ